MMKPSFSTNKALAVLLALAFIIIFLFSLMSPLMAEDYMYLFSFSDGERIEQLGDIIPSMAAHRVSMNGRVFAHSLTHLFLMLPRAVFSLFNAGNFVILLLVARRFFGTGDKLRDIFLLLGFIALSWIFMPVYGQIFFWLVGAFNYSWTFSFTLAFLATFFKAYMDADCGVLSEKGRLTQKADFFLLAFIAGGYSENASFAMLLLCACFLLLVYLRDKKVPVSLVAGFLLACCGFLFMMLAPSETGGRTSDFSFQAIASNISWMIQSTREALLPLICIFAALFALGLVAGLEKKHLISSALLVLGGAASVGVFAVAAYFPQRSLGAATVYIILACLLLSGKLLEKGYKEFLAMAGAVLTAVFIFSFAQGGMDIFSVWLESRERNALIQTAAETGESTVYLPQYNENSKYSAAFGVADVSGDMDSGYNSWMADYYGFESINCLGDGE